MKRCFLKAWAVGCLAALAALPVPSAQAYVLQGPHVIELMIERLGPVQSLLVSQNVYVYPLQPPPPAVSPAGENDSTNPPQANGGQRSPADEQNPSSGDISPPGPPVEVSETLRYLCTLRAFRSEARLGDFRRIHVFVDGRALTVVGGNLVNAGENRFDLYKDLLLYRSRPELCKRLQQLGVDVSVSSLGRFENQPAFVIGAQYPDLSVPQVWIDKDTFKPIRWIVSTGKENEGRDFLEIRYLEWWRLKKTWYPMRIEFLQNQHLVRAIEVKNCEVDPGMDRALFDLERMRTMYPPAPQPEAAEEGSGEINEVQKALEEFKRSME